MPRIIHGPADCSPRKIRRRRYEERSPSMPKLTVGLDCWRSLVTFLENQFLTGCRVRRFSTWWHRVGLKMSVHRRSLGSRQMTISGLSDLCGKSRKVRLVPKSLGATSPKEESTHLTTTTYILL